MFPENTGVTPDFSLAGLWKRRHLVTLRCRFRFYT